MPLILMVTILNSNHLGPVGSRMCLGMIMRSTALMVTLQTFCTVLIGKCQMGLRGKISTW